MSSKNLNKKYGDKNDKAEQQALKEVEIIAELAPNEKRKEAEKLMETVDNGIVNHITTGSKGNNSNPQSNSIHKIVLKFLIHISKAS